MQYEVLRLPMLHHMVFVAVAQGAGEGRSALSCVWLVAAADKRSAVARLYKPGEVRISPLELFEHQKRMLRFSRSVQVLSRESSRAFIDGQLPHLADHQKLVAQLKYTPLIITH